MIKRTTFEWLIVIGTILLVLFFCLGCSTIPTATTVQTQRPPSRHELTAQWVSRWMAFPLPVITRVAPTSSTTWDAYVDDQLVHFDITASGDVRGLRHVAVYEPEKGYH